MSGDLEPGLLGAARMIEWRLRGSHAVPPKAPRGVILTHQPSLRRELVPAFRPQIIPGLSTPLLLLKGTDAVAIASPSVGAPSAAILVEELAALGVRRVISIDIAGSLDAGLPSGSVVLIEAAVAGDGTSPHYAPSQQLVFANHDLSQRLERELAQANVGFSRGRVWTTDAPYRETAAEVAAARQQGAVLVDMECAALFAAGSALGLEVAAVLVAADELFGGWRPPADMKAVQTTLCRLAQAVKACLLA